MGWELSLQDISHAGNSSRLWGRERVNLERKEPFLSMPIILVFFPIYVYELLKQLENLKKNQLNGNVTIPLHTETVTYPWPEALTDSRRPR